MKQILTRLALTLPVVWLVVSLVFLLIHLVPGDPILQMLGESATPADLSALRHQYGWTGRCGCNTRIIGARFFTVIWGARSVFTKP